MIDKSCEYCGGPVEDLDNYDAVLGYLCDACSKAKFRLEDMND